MSNQISIVTWLRRFHYHMYSEYVSSLYDCAKMSSTELEQATQFLHEKGIILATPTS